MPLFGDVLHGSEVQYSELLQGRVAEFLSIVTKTHCSSREDSCMLSRDRDMKPTSNLFPCNSVYLLNGVITGRMKVKGKG